MFALLTLSLIGLAAAQPCPQDAYKTRTEFQRGTNQDGFDIQYWFHDGITFVGQSSNAAFATGTLNAGETFSSSTPFGTVSLDDLKANGEQVFLVLAQVELTGAAVGEECLLTIGTSPKFCIKRNARWEFTNQFGFVPTVAPSAATTLAFVARRFVGTDGTIKLDYTALNRGTSIQRPSAAAATTNLPSVVWDFSQGFTFNAPLAGQTTKITQFLVLAGRGVNLAASTTATGFLGTANANAGAFKTCVLQEWVTGTPAKPYAVPSVTAGNLVATFRRTNFQTTQVAAITAASVTWNPLITDISNVTAIAGSAGVVVAPFLTPTTTTVNFPPLDPAATQSVTFTASVFNCTKSGHPRVVMADDIKVNNVPATLFILRESRLAFTVVDKRKFDLVDLPIAAGCNVPFTYQIDVTNLGPSCVEELKLNHVFEAALDNGMPAAPASSIVASLISIPLILPGKLSTEGPFTASISATPLAGNEQSLNRSLTLSGPLDDGVFSTSLPQPHYSFFRRTRQLDPANLNILGQSYEIARYGDLQLTYEWNGDSVVAGDFADTESPNLSGVLSVKNAGCVTAIDVELVLEIEQPRGSWYFDTVGVGATNVAQRLPKITRRILVGTLDADETRSFDVQFAVCQLTKATTTALAVNAFVLRSGDTLFNGDLHQFETVEPPAVDGTKFTRLVPVNRFDDKVAEAATVSLSAVLDVKLECDAPKLATPNDFVHDGSEDGTTSETVRDIELAKLTRCRVKASNTGASNVPLKIKLDWVLPEGTHLVRWTGPNDDKNQFIVENGGGVWAVQAFSTNAAPVFNKCPARTGTVQTLELDFASYAHGDIQIVARVDKQASVATLTGATGNAHTIQV